MKVNKFFSEIAIILFTLVLILSSSDPVIDTDSTRYINQSLSDPPLYSNFIFISQSIFGSLKSVVILQTIFVAFGIFFFTKTLSAITVFDLGSFEKTAISLFLYLPVISFYDYILTETISYAFSLFFISSTINLIFKFNIQNLALTSITAIALLITRNQFLFLYPLVILIFLGLYFLKPKKKVLKLLTISLIGIFLTHNFLIILNTYMKKNIVSTYTKKEYGPPSDIDLLLKTKWTEKLTYVEIGPSYFIFIDSIYISSVQDIKLFDNQSTKDLLINIFDEMEKKKSLIKYYNGRGHFGSSFATIRDYSYPLLAELASQENISLSKLRWEISRTLIVKNFKTYLKFILKKSFDSSWLFIVVPFLILLSSLNFFISNKSNFSLVLICISLFSLSNHVVIYVFGRVQPRYFLYTDFILLIFIFMVTAALLNNRNPKIQKDKF